MIIGETDNVFLIQAYLDDAISVEDELAAVLTHITADDELVIFTDLLGGSVNNIMIREALKDNVHIVSGFNLPLLIEVIMGDANTPVTEIIETALIDGKEQMIYVNKLITQQND